MITLSVLALLYFLPTILAARNGHEITGILLLNLFFGWTGLGWFALLLWVLLTEPFYYGYRVPPPPACYYPPDWRRY